MDYRLASTLTTQTVAGDDLASELVANAKTYVDK
ncbi:hypothetical protein J2Y02_005187 [Neobacillus drentensis]|nr:hypothetical protein [Neobacillus drentensis]